MTATKAQQRKTQRAKSRASSNALATALAKGMTEAGVEMTPGALYIASTVIEDSLSDLGYEVTDIHDIRDGA